MTLLERICTRSSAQLIPCYLFVTYSLIIRLLYVAPFRKGCLIQFISLVVIMCSFRWNTTISAYYPFQRSVNTLLPIRYLFVTYSLLIRLLYVAPLRNGFSIVFISLVVIMCSYRWNTPISAYYPFQRSDNTRLLIRSLFAFNAQGIRCTLK